VTARRTLAVATGTLSAGGVAYVLQRAAARRWRVGEEELAASGLTLPPDLRHHFVPVSDGGRIHTVERAARPGPIERPARAERVRPVGTPAGVGTIVLLHGISFGVASWAPQLRRLDGRVVAVSQRGHGQSRPGSEGYAFSRLGEDLLEVMGALEVHDAVLCAHSMGGMVALLLATERASDLARHVRRLVLVATTAGGYPVPPSVADVAARVIGRAERRGRGPFPKASTVWLARLNFGSAPRPADVELVRSMLDTMSPSAFAGLVPHLLAFDVRDRLASVTLQTDVVVGGNDVFTPPRVARSIAGQVPGAELTVLPGCGHMVMLERTDELNDIIGCTR